MSAADASNNAYVVASQRYSSFNPFSSIRSLFNLGGKSIYGAYERPPYPIIIDKPTTRDIAGALRASDFVMFGSIYGAGVLWSYFLSRPFPLIMQKLLVYHGVSHVFTVFGAMMLIALPYRRLTGYADNGLRWRNPVDKLNKYDSTSEFEKATIWGRLTRK